MSTPGVVGAEEREAERELGRLAVPWWTLLIAGIFWLVYAFFVLSFDYRTVLAIAIFAGILFVLLGLGSLGIAMLVPEHKWLPAILGLIGVAAGIACFVWPDITFRALAALFAWYLLFKGAADIIMSFLSRRDDDLWWLWLIVGIAQIVIAFWAIGYEGRTLALLAIWIGVIAVMRGITDIVLAFRLRGFQHS